MLQPNGLAFQATRMEFTKTSFFRRFPSTPGIPTRLKSCVPPRYHHADPLVGVRTSSINGFQVTISPYIKIRYTSEAEKKYPILIIWFTGS